MKIEKCGFEKVAFIDVELLTLEFRTPFGESFTELKTRSEIEKLLPKKAKEFPKYVVVPLCSLNTQEGCLHRICIFFVPEKISLGHVADRVLPEIAALTGNAEIVMEQTNGAENMLYWKVTENLFYALLFFEGRLIHLWREPIKSREKVPVRLKEIQAYIEHGPSILKNTSFLFLELKAKEILLRKQSAKDFFWKRVDLEKSKKWKPCFRRRMLFYGFLITLLGMTFFAFGAAIKEKHFNEVKTLKTTIQSYEAKKNIVNHLKKQIENNPWVLDFPFYPYSIFSFIDLKKTNFLLLEGERKQGIWLLRLEYSENSFFGESFLEKIKTASHLKNWKIKQRKWVENNKEIGILEGVYVP